MADYEPIACADHERLEFAVLRRIRLALACRDEDGSVHEFEVLPIDVYTRDGAEWLQIRQDDGQETIWRLDRIVRFREISATGKSPS